MRRAFTALVRKDLRLFFTDRRAVILSVAAPIAIASFFGFIFGDGGEGRDISRLPVSVVDEDSSAISRDLVGRLASDSALDVKRVPLAEAQDAVRRAKTTVAIDIPAGFGTVAGRAFFAGGQKAELRLFYDPSRSTEANMVSGILTGHVMQSVSQEMFAGQSGQAAVGEAIPQIEQSSQMPAAQKSALLDLLHGVQQWNQTSRQGGSSVGGGLTIPFEVKKHAVTSAAGTPYNGYAHAFAGMGVQFILFMGIEMGVGLLLQRRMGMWKRLRAAPLSRGVLLGSSAASTTLISLFILLFLFLFARVVFGVRIQGSLAGFLGICVAFSLMTASFGLLIACLGKTPEGTRALSIMATLLLVMLGGAWVPTFVFPQWLQKATSVVPTRWAIDGLDATTWRGLGFSSVAQPIFLLLATALVCGGLAIARFSWEGET
jgi:ABC-2 type transport system permease protein